MKSKKAIVLMISLVLTVGIVLPGTLAVSADQAAANGRLAVTDGTQPSTPEETEASAPTEKSEPTEASTPTETGASTKAAASEKCTCGAAEGETHKEDCPLYTAPEVSAASSHTGSCSGGCTDKDCKCGCHLFAKIMACTTLDEIWAVFDEAPDAAINALTDEQNAQIDTKIEALEPAPAPAVIIEESNEKTVPSEIVYRTVNYTFVAPFGDPVTGSHG